MKDLLQSLLALSEGETKETGKGRVHKGTYGSEYETDKEGNEKKKAAPEVKKGRGRPKKDADSSGEVKKYDSSALSNVFGGGKKPTKAVGTVSKKHSLKEYMESVEDTKNAEAVMESMFEGVDHSSVAANLGKLAKVIKSVQTPEQFAVAQKYAQRMSGTIQQHQHAGMGFGSGLRANLAVSRAIQDDLKRKAAELGIEYKALEEAGDQIEIKPASATNTQVIQQGDKTLGTVNNPQLANTIKQAMGKGEMSLNPNDEKMMEAKKKPDFLDVDKDGNKKETFKKAVKDKKKVAEGRDHSSSEYLDEEIAKILAREKPGMDTVKSNDEFYSAIYHELVQQGLTPRAARGKMMDDDFISDVASAYAQYQANPTLDENSLRDFRIDGVKPTSDFTKTSGSMAAPRGTPTTANRPVPNPTTFGTDPIAATTDRAINFISGLRKPSNPFSESKTMKDMQVESWAQQLNSLLNEGITVSSSQGQQGQPDSVSVTANDADAEALLAVLRQAGIGGFGAEEPSPEIGYGVAQGGEEEPTGTGTEPQAAPDVVGDDGDMLSMLKKMAGLSGGDAVVAVGGDEGGQDYEDEEGSEEGGEEQAQTLEPADSGEEGSEESGEESDEEGEEEEQTDEGNAFTGKLKQTPQGGEFKMGDKEYKDTSSIEEGEHTCEGCGMQESECACDQEQVEENWSNDAGGDAMGDAALMKLKALLSVGNDLHKMKTTQAMGNPVRVTESKQMINEWKKLSGI